jgi:hypothetical protein
MLGLESELFVVNTARPWVLVYLRKSFVERTFFVGNPKNQVIDAERRSRLGSAVVIGVLISAVTLSAQSTLRQSTSTGGATVSAKSSSTTRLQPHTLPASIPQLGSVMTPSPAESFAISGNTAFVCDDNEVAVVNIANPSSPQRVSTAASGLLQASQYTWCSIQRATLAVFSDQSVSTIGDSPGFSAFSISNGSPPTLSLIQATPISKRFFQNPLYTTISGYDFAFVPTAAVNVPAFGGGQDQYGDVLAVDVTNLSSPALLETLETPVDPSLGPTLGGPTSVFGITLATGPYVYIGGSTSTGGANNGLGRMQVVNLGNPRATPQQPMQVVGQIDIPGTAQFTAPLIQGAVAVGIGNNGGWTFNLNVQPFMFGNVVITTFDVADLLQPQIVSTVTTTYSVGVGGGQALIGNYLYAFGGVVDSNNNNVLLVVDASNPVSPVIQSYPMSSAVRNLQAVGTTLYATLGSGGFATFSIPGLTTTTTSTCPPYVDAMLVVDRGASIPAQAFAAAQTALQGFVGTLNSSDHVGVASFTTSGTVNQELTNNTGLVDSAVDAIIPGGTSYIGAGIAAAQGELTSSRHNPAATQVMIILSDGADAGAPTPTATLTAANAAKAAGIQIISLQYGTGSTAKMQSIASSPQNFYQVPQ